MAIRMETYSRMAHGNKMLHMAIRMETYSRVAYGNKNGNIQSYCIWQLEWKLTVVLHMAIRMETYGRILPIAFHCC